MSAADPTTDLWHGPIARDLWKELEEAARDAAARAEVESELVQVERYCWEQRALGERTGNADLVAYTSTSIAEGRTMLRWLHASLGERAS